MRKTPPRFLLILIFFFTLTVLSFGQAWSGILAKGTAIDWSVAGIPGGIPSGSWTQSGSTIQASQCSNGSADCSSTIQGALNSCGASQYVLLGAGTFLIKSGLNVPSNCVLRGSGADKTILNATVKSSQDITLGSTSGVTFSSAVAITGGTTAGSTSITVGNASNISVGSFLLIDQTNDGTVVSQNGSEGACSWCDAGQTNNGSRAQGQISRVTSVSGSSIGISPGLFVAYTRTPLAAPVKMSAQYAGIEELQIYANNSHSSNPSSIEIGNCAYCWVSGVESNYTDGDHIDFDWSFGSEVINSYFSGTFGTGPGSFDHGIRVANKSTLNLIQNNIMERTGVLEQEWGAAGNVFGYNYMTGGYSTSAPNFMSANIEMHGAHPQFNLFEGNVVNKINYDSIWGSSAYNTTFRNWIRGAALACNPLSGSRGNVVCTPIGVQGKNGVNGWWQIQAVRAFDLNFLATYDNMIGDIVGSAEMAALTQYDGGTPMGQVANVSAPSSRSYDADAYALSFGYGEAGDGGGSMKNGSGCDGNYSYPCESSLPSSTAFIHGLYNNVNGSTTWASGVTHTLPASFYLPAQPAWWTSGISWPPIGPDVSGGSGPASHVNMNPAQNCYVNVMGGAEGGAGGPLTFNASNCYSSGTGGSVPPPTGLTATVH